MTQVNSTYDWLDLLPLDAGLPDLRMGTRALDIADWLPVDNKTDEELLLRAELLDTYPGLVRQVPGHEEGIEELMSLAEIHLGRRFERTPATALEQLARQVPDDILVLWRDHAHWRLVAGALVFPNQWTIEDKIGRTVADIHAPVDGYSELLESRVDNFFDRLTAKRPVWRRNWFFHDDPTYYQPDRMPARLVTNETDAAGLWIRSEWQTLRRLVFSGLIIFTVKTQIAPISELAARPETARKMAEFLRSASKRSLANKDALGRHRAIVDYLELAQA